MRRILALQNKWCWVLPYTSLEKLLKLYEVIRGIMDREFLSFFPQTQTGMFSTPPLQLNAQHLTLKKTSQREVFFLIKLLILIFNQANFLHCLFSSFINNKHGSLYFYLISLFGNFVELV